MFLLVKKIDGEDIIIGTAQKSISLQNAEMSGITIYEISDKEFVPNMVSSKIESFDEDIG